MKTKPMYRPHASWGTPLQKQRHPGKYLLTFLLLALVSLSIPQNASAAGKPAKITGLKCGVTTQKSINISWASQNGVSGYQVYRASSYDGPYKKIKTVAAGNHQMRCPCCNRPCIVKCTQTCRHQSFCDRYTLSRRQGYRQLYHQH